MAVLCTLALFPTQSTGNSSMASGFLWLILAGSRRDQPSPVCFVIWLLKRQNKLTIWRLPSSDLLELRQCFSPVCTHCKFSHVAPGKRLPLSSCEVITAGSCAFVYHRSFLALEKRTVAPSRPQDWLKWDGGEPVGALNLSRLPVIWKEGRDDWKEFNNVNKLPLFHKMFSGSHHFSPSSGLRCLPLYKLNSGKGNSLIR